MAEKRDERMEWQPIESAPFQTVIEVKNDQMKHPCLATRGYVHNGAVHEDTTFCTSVFTPDPDGLWPVPEGMLVCPTHWRPVPQAAEEPPHG